MATLEAGLLSDINVLAGRIADARALDARRDAAQIKALTLELRAKWDELRAARVASLAVDLTLLPREGYHNHERRPHRPVVPYVAELQAQFRHKSSE